MGKQEKQMEYKIDIKSKREKEKNIVKLMIELYCKGHKHTENGLCDSCEELVRYSHKRVDLCPFMETKTFCQHCRVHCYSQEMREKIKEVMRYSGPRMLFFHPIIVIKHGIESFKDR